MLDEFCHSNNRGYQQLRYKNLQHLNKFHQQSTRIAFYSQHDENENGKMCNKNY